MKLKLIKKFVFNACAALLTYSVCVNSVSASGSWSVSFTGFPQEKTKWCWVASAQCSGKHMVASNRTQTDAVIYVFGVDVNITGEMEHIAKAANYFTFNRYNYVGQEKKYSYVLFKVQLMNNQIPIAAAGYYNGNVRKGGHATPVHALYQGNNNEIVLTYYDPGINKDYYITYDNFCNGSVNGRKYDYTCFIN